jgi:hypothetical protein
VIPGEARLRGDLPRCVFGGDAGVCSREHEPVFPIGQVAVHVHLQAANNLTDAWTRFVVVMVCRPGEPMLTLVDRGRGTAAAQEGLDGSEPA